MALTQISTAGVKDDIVTAAKIADDAVTATLIADDAVVTAAIADDAVTAAKLANSINTEIAANTAKTTNATHSGEVTGATALTIADNVVDEANLKVSNSPTNGQFLSAQSGNTGGLTWATVSAGMTDIVSDTSPQLGGDLDTNSFEILLDDDHKVKFGAGNDLQIWHDATGGNYSYIFNYGAALLKIGSDQNIVLGKTSNENYIIAKPDNNVELYYDNALKLATDSGGVNVTGGLNVSGNLHCTSDGGKLIAGVGDDLQIYHDGTDSIIYNQTNKLRLRGDDIWFRNAADNEQLAKFTNGAGVELYFNDSKKFETASNGCYFDGHVMPGSNGGYDLGLNATRWGDVYIKDSKEIKLGDSNDLEIYHDGTDSRIKNETGQLILQSDDLLLRNEASSENYLRAQNNGSVELYYDNSKKFETLTNGAKTSGNHYITGELYAEAEINMISSSDDHKYLDVGIGTNIFSIRKTTGGDSGHENIIRMHGDGAVELYYDNSKKVETTSTGVTLTGEVSVTSNLLLKSSWSQRLYFGANNDLQIYHNGTNGQIDNNTGNLELRNTGSFGSERQLQIKAKVDENSIVCKSDGAVELYHNNSKRFETLAAGVKAVNICKAWCNYDGRDNSIRASFNISSVTDNGTGDYTFNWSVATLDDYGFVGTAGEWLKSGTDRRVLSYRHGSSSNDYGDASYLKVRTFGLNTNQTADSKVVSIAAYSNH